MGGNCTTPTLTTLPSYTETVKGTELPAFVAAGGRELYDQARNLAFQPYPEYTGPRSATYDEIDPLTGEARMEMGFNLVDTRDGFDPTTGQYYFNDQIMPSKEAYEQARSDYFTPTRTGIDYSQIQDRPLEGFTDDTAKGLYRSERDAGGKYLDDAVYDAAGNVVYRPDSNIPRTDEEIDKIFSDYNIPQLMSSASAADLTGGFREMETGEMVPVQSRLTQQEQEAQRLLGQDTYQGYLTGFDSDGDGIADTQSASTFLEGLGGEFKLGEGTEAQKYMDIYSAAMDPAIRDIQQRTIQEQNKARAQAGRTGAFGSRLGIQEALLGSEGIQSEADLRARGLAEGLQFASQRFDTDETQRRQALDSYTQMAGLTQALQEQQAAGLITAGEAERQLDQQALDIAYADYLDRRKYPREAINFALGTLQGTPYDTISRGYTMSEATSQGPSVYGQAIGGLGALGSAFAMRGS
jgi:hypothetical protein